VFSYGPLPLQLQRLSLVRRDNCLRGFQLSALSPAAPRYPGTRCCGPSPFNSGSSSEVYRSALRISRSSSPVGTQVAA
jgi:hypothetical protein